MGKYLGIVALIVVNILFFGFIFPAMVSSKTYELPAIALLMFVIYLPAMYYSVKALIKKEEK